MTPQFPHPYVLNVMADDHPGIVAAVTRAVRNRAGNIDACSQTVLEGYFTLIMIVSFAEPVPPETLAAEVRGEPALGFQVQVRPFRPVTARAPVGKHDQFVLAVFGKDRPGIVHRFSEYLAGQDINIIDLYAHRQGDDFLMIGQLEIPAARDVSLLRAELEHVAAEGGFTVRLQHENIFVATNQLRLTHSPER